ncbi:MAG: hypothetical protein WC797_02655 [Candidatus Paceibacterota bacterium]|jgi:hypothetical protein
MTQNALKKSLDIFNGIVLFIMFLAAAVVGFLNGSDLGVMFGTNADRNPVFICYAVGVIFIGWSPLLWMDFCLFQTAGFLIYATNWQWFWSCANSNVLGIPFAGVFGMIVNALAVFAVVFSTCVCVGAVASWIICKYLEIIGCRNIWGWQRENIWEWPVEVTGEETK